MPKDFSTIPVVVFLGHIDHGKTSLLEKILKKPLTSKEAGGITQHVGAHEIEFEGKKITFLDTPGHEAFNEMRCRGAKVADIAVLVVAANEGVKEQTKEAIKVIKSAKIPMLVAINKIDKEGANPEKTKAELSEEGVLIEEWGGNVPCVLTSAKTGEGIEDLLSMINLLAEVSEIKKSLKKPTEGFVIESFLDPKRGASAVVIVEKGTLKKGDIIGTETSFGKVRILENPEFSAKKEAIPGEAAIIVGFRDLPVVGEKFFVFKDEKSAQEFLRKKKEKVIFPKRDKEIKIVLKADTQGSLEVLEKILAKIEGKEALTEGEYKTLGVRVIKRGIGEVTDLDVKFADEENAEIFAFRVSATEPAKSLSFSLRKKIHFFETIYEMTEKTRKILLSLKEKKKIRHKLATMQVLVVFKTQKRGSKLYRQIVGGKILEGEAKKSFLDIERKEEILKGGKIMEMQKQKREIEKAKAGEEIGILYEGKTKIKLDDKLILWEEKEI